MLQFICWSGSSELDLMASNGLCGGVTWRTMSPRNVTEINSSHTTWITRGIWMFAFIYPITVRQHLWASSRPRWLRFEETAAVAQPAEDLHVVAQLGWNDGGRARRRPIFRGSRHGCHAFTTCHRDTVGSAASAGVGGLSSPSVVAVDAAREQCPITWTCNNKKCRQARERLGISSSLEGRSRYFNRLRNIREWIRKKFWMFRFLTCLDAELSSTWIMLWRNTSGAPIFELL